MAGRYRWPQARLGIFAKPPVPGRVKSRLAAAIGARAAARAYRDLLAETLQRMDAACLAPMELWVTTAGHPSLRRLARRHGATIRVQSPGDLGTRLLAALQGSTPTVIIGGDCPGLGPTQVAAAYASLSRGARAVFSPAQDGGYTLVGTQQPHPTLFRGIPWGGSGVMSATRRQARRRGVELVELPTSWDVDTTADWARWLRTRKHDSAYKP